VTRPSCPSRVVGRQKSHGPGVAPDVVVAMYTRLQQHVLIAGQDHGCDGRDTPRRE